MVKIKRLKDRQEFIDALNMIFEDGVTYNHIPRDKVNKFYRMIRELEED
jgi:hypothetical protein